MKNQLVKYQAEGRSAVITMDNPPVNVMNKALRVELRACLQEAVDDDGVTSIILTGSGKAFMAGADINGFTELFGLPQAVYDFLYDVYQDWYYVETIKKPVIVAMNGLALGAGVELALCGDLRVASRKAKLGLPEISLGLFPGGGGTQRVTKIVGKSKAKQMIFLGEPIDAERALAFGLVDYVVEPEQVLAKALEIAEKINKFSLVALKAAKTAINAAEELGTRDGIDLEAREFQQVFLGEDIREGVAAFLEKRSPVFKNR
jgi:enoyl-CoA hydratase/carnithine racemase